MKNTDKIMTIRGKKDYLDLKNDPETEETSLNYPNKENAEQKPAPHFNLFALYTGFTLQNDLRSGNRLLHPAADPIHSDNLLLYNRPQYPEKYRCHGSKYCREGTTWRSSH